MRTLAWLGAAIFLFCAAVLILATQALQGAPLVSPGADLPADTITRAKNVLRRNDPRRLPPNATREIRVAGGDLEALLNFAAHRGLDGAASLDLRDGGANVRYSTRLPRPIDALGIGRYLNVDARLGLSNARLQIEQVHIGRLPVPGSLFQLLLGQYVRHTDLAPAVELLRKSIYRIAITPDDVAVTYVWHPELLNSARALAVSPAERQRLAAAQRLFADTLDRASETRRRVPLAAVLGPLLQEASRHTDRAQAYQDVLLVAAIHLSGKPIALLIPEAAHWPRPRPAVLTLRERDDLAQHFVISAAVAAAGSVPLAKAVGLEKEIDDSRHGSGFSFVNLAADKAGTRLGELAARDPERLANAVAAGLSDAALLPSIDGLPEHMMAEEFQNRFGSPAAPAYRQMTDEIDRRIAALALFR